MKDIHVDGSLLDRLLRRRRLLLATGISKSSKRRAIGIDIQGGLGNGGEAKAVLGYDGENRLLEIANSCRFM